MRSRIRPAGGWPVLEIVMPRADVKSFVEWYCADDADYWESEILEGAKSL